MIELTRARHKNGKFKHSAYHNWKKKKNRPWSDFSPYFVAIFGLISYLGTQIYPVYAYIQKQSGEIEILREATDQSSLRGTAIAKASTGELVSANSEDEPLKSEDGSPLEESQAPSSVEAKIMHYFPSHFEKAKKVFTCESGLNPKKHSDVDLMEDGRAFSVGIAQINLTVSEVGGVNCTKAFQGRNDKAKVIDEPLYNTCVALAEDADLNLQEAQKKMRGTWGAWTNCDNQTK